MRDIRLYEKGIKSEKHQKYQEYEVCKEWVSDK
jgi:hypothetical protein